MEDRQKIIEKLVKIKALAERGVGGEQQTAQQMYEALKKRYGITDEEVNRAAVPVDISGIDLKKFWGISFRMALIVYSLNEEQKTCEMCRQVLLQEPECETCSTYKNTFHSGAAHDYRPLYHTFLSYANNACSLFVCMHFLYFIS